MLCCGFYVVFLKMQKFVAQKIKYFILCRVPSLLYSDPVRSIPMLATVQSPVVVSDK